MTKSSLIGLSETEALKVFIQNGNLQHIAIIMDGNRRWAQSKIFPSSQGHYEGYKTLKTILEYCSDELKLPVLTVYAFSTENWRRSEDEVDFLLKLFRQILKKEINALHKRNIRLKFLGNIEEFSRQFQQECYHAESLTCDNKGMLFQVAWNYGGRAEIVESCKKLAQEVKEGRLTPEEINEELISTHLYTKNVADPDMIIRTGGEYRLSNFLLWQSAYTELCVVNELWPDFTPDVLNQTVMDFQNRTRRFGQ